MPAVSREIFESVLQEERETNARYLNALRPVGVAVFLLVHVVFGRSDFPATCVLGVYLVVSIALFFLSRRSDRVARWSTLAVPFFDVPAVFLKQWLDMGYSPTSNDRAIAVFTLGPFLVLIMLSALTLKTWRLVLAGLLVAVFELALQFKAGDTLYGKYASVATIISAVALCEIAIARRIALAHRISEEQLRRERLHRYFSPQVARTIEQDEQDYDTGHLCEITVLFSDLRGFCAFSQDLPPAAVLGLLNEVHSRMVEVVFAHGGTLDKYIGDGLMAYFGAPIPQTDHAARALNCAQQMLLAFASLSSARAARGELTLRLSIGLNTGTAVVGSIGAVNRREFTAVGDTVNLAARMESLTREYDADILVSGETARKAGTACTLRLLGETPVKGRTQPVQVFAPATSPASG
jgi:adenylate cyclase